MKSKLLGMPIITLTKWCNPVYWENTIERSRERQNKQKFRPNKKVLQQEYEDLANMHNKKVMEKDEEISHFKDHVEKLIAQVKKTKITKKESKKHLFEQEE